MKVLLLYATYSNSTLLASQVLADEIKAAGHEVNLQLVKETDVDRWGNYDLIILASPSWDFNGQQGLYHEDFIELKPKLAERNWPDKKFAVMGLGDHTFTYFCGCVEHLEDMVKDVQGKLVIPSLRLDQYYLNETVCQNQIKEWAKVLLSRI